MSARHEAMTLQLTLVGGIGPSKPINAIDVAATLRRDRHAPVRAAISSTGGDLPEAWRIHDEFRNHKGVVDLRVVDSCHSSAALLLVGADYRVASPRARFGFHQPWCPGATDADLANPEFRYRLREAIEAEQKRMAECLASRSRGTSRITASSCANGRWSSRRMPSGWA